jgi:hypothetical protein
MSVPDDFGDLSMMQAGRHSMDQTKMADSVPRAPHHAISAIWQLWTPFSSARSWPPSIFLSSWYVFSKVATITVNIIPDIRNISSEESENSGQILRVGRNENPTSLHPQLLALIHHRQRTWPLILNNSANSPYLTPSQRGWHMGSRITAVRLLMVHFSML